MNEEMYEEEDDDLPMQYRRLTAHLQTQNAYFDRRINAYISSQMAMRQAMGQAVADQWQANNQQQTPGQFTNPGMMQTPMQQPWYQNQMLPPDMSNRMSQSYRHAPYPVPSNAQGMRHGFNNRSPSVATTPDMSFHPQQQRTLSTQTSPVDNVGMDGRRTSLPFQNTQPQTPHSQSGPTGATPGNVSPVASRSGSSSHSSTGTPHVFYKQSTGSPKQAPTPPGQNPSMTSPFDQSFNNMMNHFTPLTPTLPMETQQMLGFNMTDPTTNMFVANNTQGMKSQPPFYSYNPNGKPKAPRATQSASDGLSQTLAPSSLDTSVGGFDPSVFTYTPQSASTDLLNSPFPSGGLYNFDASLGMDAFVKPSHSVGHSSGHVTPGISGEDIGTWAEFFDYGESSQSAV